MIEIRQGTEKEYFETEVVIREAFWNQYAPACCEHYLLHTMRPCPAFLAELDLIAVDEQKVVGSSVCMKGRIVGDNGTCYEVLTLGPIGVLPEYQTKGVGSMLIARTKEVAKEMGFRGILLCGDPDYYGKQGFVPAEELKIRNAENMYADALQVFELYEQALADAKGRYFEDEGYQIDELRAKEYDKRFPEKEAMSGVKMQKRFEELVQRVRPYCE